MAEFRLDGTPTGCAALGDLPPAGHGLRPGSPDAPADTKAAARVGALVAILTLSLLWFWIVTVWSIMANSGNPTVAVDFQVFWGAARLAALGEGPAAFDIEQLAAAYGGDPEIWLPWVYPPGLMLAIWPLGLLGFHVAWMAFVAVSLLAMLGAVRLYDGAFRPSSLAFALSPALLPALMLGQVGVLWAAGLLAALAFLRDGRTAAAGVMLGLLTFKPQLGVLAAVALLAAGQWRVIFVAATTCVLLHGTATLVFGASYWPAFFETGARHAEELRSSIAGSDKMVSAYSALTSIGLPERVALGLQWALAAVAALAVWICWARPALSFDVRAAVLFCAIPVATPYLWYPDTALLAPALLLLVRAGRITRHPASLFLAFLMSTGVPLWLFAAILLGEGELPMQYYVPAVLVAVFLVAATPLMRQGAARGAGRVAREGPAP